MAEKLTAPMVLVVHLLKCIEVRIRTAGMGKPFRHLPVIGEPYSHPVVVRKRKTPTVNAGYDRERWRGNTDLPMVRKLGALLAGRYCSSTFPLPFLLLMCGDCSA